MAYVDDRVWCHPKFTDVSLPAFAIWVRSVAYSSGLNTKGVLTEGQQKLVGSSAKIRAELVQAELWDDHPSGVCIHDWDDYNGKRDDRKERERQRLREYRARKKEEKEEQQQDAERTQYANVYATKDVHGLTVVKEVTTPISPSGNIGKDGKPEPRSSAVHGATCADCGETYGSGHLESCPRLAVSA